jgi:hypothetical protein
MRCVGRNVAEERSLPIAFDKAEGFGKPDIGTVALIRLITILGPGGIIEVVVAPIVRCVAHPTSTVCHYFLKAPVLRPVRIVIAQMPFAKDPCTIAGAGEEIGHATVL